MVRTTSEDVMETVNHFIMQLQINVRAHVACGLIVLEYKYLTAVNCFDIPSKKKYKFKFNLIFS